MRGCTHEVGSDLRISFDNESGELHVEEYRRLIPGWHGEWQEVAVFTEKAAWYSSKYSKVIMSEYYLDMILWHWIDLEGLEGPRDGQEVVVRT